MTKSEYTTRRRAIEALYREMKKERIRSKPKTAKAVGRPKSEAPAPIKCRRDGCEKIAVNGYCSSDHAPLARWGKGDYQGGE